MKIRIVIRPSAGSPARARSKFTNVRTKSEAPTRTMRASAISPTTSAPRRRLRATLPPAPRPPSLRLP
jgi:hypothetical protein